MTTDDAVPTTAEAEILREWHRYINRLDEDLTGQEQLLACYDEIYPALLERGSRFVFPWTRMVYMHWAAIGVRRVFRRGSQPQNVSISRLLQRLVKDVSLIRRFGDQSSLKQWLGVASDAPIVDAQIVVFLKSEDTRLNNEIVDIKEYADTIAHLQHQGVELKKERIAAALKSFRAFLDHLYAVLRFQRPSRDVATAFVDKFENELERLLRNVSAEPG